jgi:hypothetical protein
MPQEVPITPSAKTASPSGGSVRGGNKTTRLRDDIAQFYGTLGMAAVGIGIATGDAGINGTGQAIVMRADTIADAWVELAQKNLKVKKALEQITGATSMGGIIGVHVMVLIPFLADRGMVPPLVAAAFQATPDAYDPNGAPFAEDE